MLLHFLLNRKIELTYRIAVILFFIYYLDELNELLINLLNKNVEIILAIKKESCNFANTFLGGLPEWLKERFAKP